MGSRGVRSRASWVLDEAGACSVAICSSLCKPETIRDVTCEECKEVIDKIFAGVNAEQTVEKYVNYLSGEAFCGNPEEVAAEDTERCKRGIAVLIPAAMEVFSNNKDPEEADGFCNQVLGVC